VISMQKQDLDAKVEDNSNNRWLSGKFGRLCAMTSLLFIALTGCAEKPVEITGKVTRIEARSSTSDPYKNKTTGEIEREFYTSCNIYLDSGNGEYKLEMISGYSIGICDQVIEASAGVQCCEEFKSEYENGELKETVDSTDTEQDVDKAAKRDQCNGVKCYFFDSNPTDYNYKAVIEDKSKSPVVTCSVHVDDISTETGSNGNEIKKVNVDYRYWMEKNESSTFLVKKSPFMRKKTDFFFHYLKR